MDRKVYFGEQYNFVFFLQLFIFELRDLRTDG